ncbi:MAG: hypothetical protein ACLQVD_17780 [Capsulimonadaceae bacterium]
MLCYRHKRVETAVSCGRCDRPICTQCMIPGPAGIRCPECAAVGKLPFDQVPPARLALATVAGLATGFLGAWILASIPFFSLFLAYYYGGLLAEIVFRAAGRRGARQVTVISISSIILGYVPHIVSSVLIIVHAFGSAAGGAMAMLLVWPVLSCGIAVATCYARCRSI